MSAPFEKQLLGLVTWLEPELDFMGPDLAMRRQLSLMTWEILQLTGFGHLFDPQASLTPEQEAQGLLIYGWLHEAEIADISAALISGAWRKIIEQPFSPMPALLALWQAYRAHVVACIQASDFRVIPRPGGGEKIPPEVCPAPPLASRLRLLMAETGLPEHHLLWEKFYPQTLQLEHAARYWHGSWTAPLARDTTREDLEDIVPEWMTGSPT